MLGTRTAVSSSHLLFTFAVLWLEQVHSNQSAQPPVAQPHGDSGLKAPERFAGHEVDAPLVPGSQRARKGQQRQLAQLRSVTNVAAEADLQPVSALGKQTSCDLYACFRWVRLSLQCSRPCFDRFSPLFAVGPCLSKHVASELLCLLTCAGCRA